LAKSRELLCRFLNKHIETVQLSAKQRRAFQDFNSNFKPDRDNLLLVSNMAAFMNCDINSCLAFAGRRKIRIRVVSDIAQCLYFDAQYDNKYSEVLIRYSDASNDEHRYVLPTNDDDDIDETEPALIFQK